MVKLAEKRDELEKLIEKQKGKSQPAAEAGVPERESKMVAPATPQQMPQQQMPQQAGFSGMQPSMMESGEAPPPAMPQQQPQQQMPQQMPSAMPPQPMEMPPQQEIPEAEPEEMATIAEPSFPAANLSYNRSNIEEIEALIESVVEEKWRQAMESFQDINLWKEKARTEIISIKQEILRLEQRFENMEKSMIGRVHEYDKNILNVGAEIKAMERVLQKILQPLTKNVRDLENITKKLKK